MATPQQEKSSGNDCPAERSLRQWLRKPDAAFWLALFAPAPVSTPSDYDRRFRLTRYALGMAALATLPYVLISLAMGVRDFLPIILLNALAVLGYGIGMWAASLGAHRAARLWLMVTLEGQLVALVFLTGQVLGVSIFTVVAAALAHVLFTPQEKPGRWIFTLVPLALLVAALTVIDRSLIDFATAPDWVVAFARVGNTIFAALTIILLLGVFDHEVLRSEAGLVEERNRSDRLLHAVLPSRIAGELRVSGRTIADRHPEVTVLFADLAGFTPWAAQREPEEVVAVLDRIFSRFDRLVAAAGAEKIKTIGDAYMVVAGAPEPCADHARLMARLALRLLREVQEVRRETGIALDVRIGLHTGPVIAGVIGTVRFAYDIWGDTVNTASRMESHGEPGRIQITTETRSCIGLHFRVEPRGVVDVKGKGPLATFWLLEETPTA
ncbi:MAG: adenylate/guanylate cyclase domain-containing protein [Pseudomonadota bacterium]